MAELYLLKFPSEEKNNEFLNSAFDALPCPVKEKIAKTAEKKTKAERIYTYSFLFERLANTEFSFKKIDKSLEFTEKGKPYIKNGSIYISVSHSDGIAAVALSYDKAIGVDVEKIDLSKKEKLKKIIDRFCPDLKIIYNENIVISQAFSAKKNGFIDCGKPKSETVSEENESFAKWTALESALKCHGGGFSALCEKNTILNLVTISSGVISIDKENYAISVSEAKENI